MWFYQNSKTKRIILRLVVLIGTAHLFMKGWIKCRKQGSPEQCHNHCLLFLIHFNYLEVVFNLIIFRSVYKKVNFSCGLFSLTKIYPFKVEGGFSLLTL